MSARLVFTTLSTEFLTGGGMCSLTAGGDNGRWGR